MTDAAADLDEPAGARRLAANAAWMVAGQAVAKVGSFAFVLVVTRGLDTTAYGRFNFAVSFVPLFLIVGTWGLDIAVIREVARDRRRFSPVFASGLVLRLGLGTAAAAVSLLAGRLFVRSGTAYLTLALVALALLADEVTNLFGSAFKAFERMGWFSLALVVNRVASTVAAVVVVAAGGGIVAVSAVYLLGSLSALAAAALVLRRGFPPVRLADANRATVRELLHHGAPLGVAAALNMALFRVDAVLLQAIEGTVAVAVYGVAYRFLDSFLFVAYGLGVVAMPRIARSQWSAESARGFNTVLALMLAFYVPLAIGGVAYAPWAVTTVFGERYADAADAVRWLTAAGAFYAVAYLCRFSVVALGKRHVVAVVAGAVLACNVAGNLVAIPRWGYQGAAAMTFLSEVVEAVALATLLVRTVGRVRLDRLVTVPLLGGGAMAAAVVLVGRHDGVGVAVGAASYLVALLVAGVLLVPRESRRLGSLVRAR